MMPGVIAGALMAFVTAINELSSSIILYVGGTVTMPVKGLHPKLSAASSSETLIVLKAPEVNKKTKG